MGHHGKTHEKGTLFILRYMFIMNTFVNVVLTLFKVPPPPPPNNVGREANG